MWIIFKQSMDFCARRKSNEYWTHLNRYDQLILKLVSVGKSTRDFSFTMKIRNFEDFQTESNQTVHFPVIGNVFFINFNNKFNTDGWVISTMGIDGYCGEKCGEKYKYFYLICWTQSLKNVKTANRSFKYPRPIKLFPFTIILYVNKLYFI